MKYILKLAVLIAFMIAPFSMLAQTPTVDAINFKGSTNVFIARHGIGAPASSCTGLFHYIQDNDTTSGNPTWECQNGTMVHLTGGGGGSANPAGPAFAINFANATVSAFQGDSRFTIDPINHILNTSGGNYIMGPMDSLPRRVFDPMNTIHLGGLAAALAGTSGFTPTQVIQATLDYAACQAYAQSPTVSYSRVILPTGLNIPISQLLSWGGQELSGEAEVAQPMLQHNDSTKPMLAMHGSTDVLTCPGGVTHTIGFGANVWKNLGINGMGTNVSTDIGIELAAPSTGEHCVRCRVSHISGGGNQFGGQGILLLGTSNFVDHVGYEDAQINGCGAYTHGTEPISHSPTGRCGAVEDTLLDGELDYAYVSDSAQFLTGKGPGACYPNCAGFVFTGLNGHANKVFSQISDVGMIIGGTNARFNDERIDATSMEGIQITPGTGGHILNGFTVTAPCTSTSLQSNFNAGIATNCFGAIISGGGQLVTNVNINSNGGIFGTSYMQAAFDDGVSAGNPPNYYNFLSTSVTNADNLSPNLRPMFWAGVGGQVPPVVSTPSGFSSIAHGATANISGVSQLQLGSATPLNSVTGYIPGQIVTIYATFGQGTATINNNQTTGGGIVTCTGLPITVTSIRGALFQYSLNNLSELGCETQLNHSWINWAGNPTPTAPSFVDFYGNAQARQSPGQAAPDLVTNLHGATTTGSACFVLESAFPDGSHVVSAQSCTSINLATLTAGGIFAGNLPQAASFNLYLISNTQPSAVPIGKNSRAFKRGNEYMAMGRSREDHPGR